MRKFDTKVQHLKYKVLREVAKQAWNDTLLDNRSEEHTSELQSQR